jgi:hypothetical protein
LSVTKGHPEVLAQVEQRIKELRERVANWHSENTSLNDDLFECASKLKEQTESIQGSSNPKKRHTLILEMKNIKGNVCECLKVSLYKAVVSDQVGELQSFIKGDTSFTQKGSKNDTRRTVEEINARVEELKARRRQGFPDRM